VASLLVIGEYHASWDLMRLFYLGFVAFSPVGLPLLINAASLSQVTAI
jgi:hypothetical protein